MEKRMKRHLSFALVGFLGLLLVQPVSASYGHYDRDEIITMLEDEAWRQGVPAALVVAVAKVESDFNPRAKSSAGARGVMQIMPRTAERELGVSRHRLYNPQVNIEAGVRFLKHLLDCYDGRVDIALSHYNGGSGVVHRGRWRIIPATRSYVRKVLKLKDRYTHYYASHAHVPDWRRVLSADLDDFGPEGSLTVWSYRKSHKDLPIPRIKVRQVHRQILVDELHQLALHNANRPRNMAGNGPYRW
jgi:hypothetical protein